VTFSNVGNLPLDLPSADLLSADCLSLKVGHFASTLLPSAKPTVAARRRWCRFKSMLPSLRKPSCPRNAKVHAYLKIGRIRQRGGTVRGTDSQRSAARSGAYRPRAAFDLRTGGPNSAK